MKRTKGRSHGWCYIQMVPATCDFSSRGQLGPTVMPSTASCEGGLVCARWLHVHGDFFNTLR